MFKKFSHDIYMCENNDMDDYIIEVALINSVYVIEMSRTFVFDM